MISFFKNIFLFTGILWFFCAISIIIFELHFGTKEIIATLVVPLVYGIVRVFDKTESNVNTDNSNSI